MKKESEMKKLTIFAVTLLMIFSSTLLAQDMIWYRVTAVNGTGGAVDDFHATFSGTGGSIANLKVIQDPGTGTVEVGASNQVDITWDAGSVAAGATLVFSFSAEFSGVVSAGAEWTIGGETAGAVEVVIEELPYSPAPSLTQYGLIGLAILIAISGVWIYKRRRASVAA